MPSAKISLLGWLGSNAMSPLLMYDSLAQASQGMSLAARRWDPGGSFGQ
jgi:hypothetical protein